MEWRTGAVYRRGWHSPGDDGNAVLGEVWCHAIGLTLHGDYNQDGVLDNGDLLRLDVGIRNLDFFYDLDLNGTADVNDRNFWVKELAKTSFGDADLNGTFDTLDLIRVFVAGEYNDGIAGNSTWETGDWTGDREFDSGDLIALFRMEDSLHRSIGRCRNQS